MQSTLDALARFARLLATAPTSVEVQELLVESAVDFVGADAAALVIVDAKGGPQLVARRNFDHDVPGELTEDILGGDLAERLRTASRGKFASASPMPLVAAGGLYGVLVLFFAGAHRLDDEKLKLAGTLADLVAATLARGKELDELERAYEELQASRQALAQAEKMRALGGMAAGISHDLKNVFGPMLMMLDVLKASTHDGDQMRAHVEMMRRPLENGLGIVDRLRLFSRQSAGDASEICDVNAIVDDAAVLCRPRIGAGSNIELRVEHDDRAPLIHTGYADSVAAVTNLIVNALDALASTDNGARGGVVTVRTGARDGGAVIDVVDNGPGVPVALRERIFESFFTTKGKEGTGLGLAMVKELAQRHGGTLTLESPAKGDGDGDGGAHFSLWLPAAPQVAPAS